jgi:hypothetical protein
MSHFLFLTIRVLHTSDCLYVPPPFDITVL